MATDACGVGPVTVALAQPLDPLWIGTHAVTWRATDAAGNVAEAAQTVTIERLAGDIDVDGDVDNDDLDIIIAARGETVVPGEEEDEVDWSVDPRTLDGDGDIDLDDARALPLCMPSACASRGPAP